MDEPVHQRVVARREAEVEEVEQHTLDLFNRRMTMRSYPRLVGMVLTRMSNDFPAIFLEILPSWGGASRRC